MLTLTRRTARIVVALAYLVCAIDVVGAAGDPGPQGSTVTIRAAPGSAVTTAEVAAVPDDGSVTPAAPLVDPSSVDTSPVEVAEVAEEVPTGDGAPPPAPTTGAAPLAVPEVAVAAPEPPAVPACAEVQHALVAEVSERVNALRAEHGVGPLVWDGQLACLAREWSDRMATERSMYHRDLYPVLRSEGWFRWVTLAENLVAGGTVMDARTIVNVWLTSPAHLATMLSGDYQWTGIGIATAGDLMYVTQNFGRLR